jgi:hypothetical protein
MSNETRSLIEAIINDLPVKTNPKTNNLLKILNNAKKNNDNLLLEDPTTSLKNSLLWKAYKKSFRFDKQGSYIDDDAVTIIKILLRHGEPADLKDTDGNTLLDHICLGNPELADEGTIDYAIQAEKREKEREAQEEHDRNTNMSRLAEQDEDVRDVKQGRRKSSFYDLMKKAMGYSDSTKSRGGGIKLEYIKGSMKIANLLLTYLKLNQIQTVLRTLRNTTVADLKNEFQKQYVKYPLAVAMEYKSELDNLKESIRLRIRTSYKEQGLPSPPDYSPPPTPGSLSAESRNSASSSTSSKSRRGFIQSAQSALSVKLRRNPLLTGISKRLTRSAGGTRKTKKNKISRHSRRNK